ncbi:MAG: NADH-ubiquinone oxidoreductase-F iron-sulfur binding region domain-containing protein [Nocardioides sp.]
MTLTSSPPTTRRLLADEPPTGRLPDLDLTALVEVAEAAGLTGRGGGGFPTATKLRAVARSRRAVVVANAMEGEPLSHKDAVLLHHAPHLVIDGLALLARAARAKRAILAVGPEIDPARVRAAARSRRHLEVVHLEGGGFVAGHESALVNQLSGRRAVPSDPLVRVTESGVDGRPTLVLNAETVAHLALAARHGADWFREVGTPDDPGTSLFTIGGAVQHPGVVEAARGSRLADVLAGAGPVAPAAVLVGGYHGAWVPASDLDVRLTRTDLAPYGASVGAGVLSVLDTHTCPIAHAADVATFLAGESAGQCGPCLNGLPRMADSLRRLAVGVQDEHLPAQVARMQQLVTGRGACAHPDGTARFVGSTMRVFRGHVRAHLEGWCPSERRRP